MGVWNSELVLFHPCCKAVSFKLNSSKSQFIPFSEMRHHSMGTTQPACLVFRSLDSERAKSISLQGQWQSSSVFIWTSERCKQTWRTLDKSFKTIMWLQELPETSSQELNIHSPVEQSPTAVGDWAGNFWESSSKVQNMKVFTEIQIKPWDKINHQEVSWQGKVYPIKNDSAVK